MDNQLFDHTLRDFIREGELPIEEGAWEQMSARLQAEVTLPPARRPTRILLPYRLAGAAAMIGVIVVTGWWMEAGNDALVHPEVASRQSSEMTVKRSLPTNNVQEITAPEVRTAEQKTVFYTNPNSPLRTTPGPRLQQHIGMPSLVPLVTNDSAVILAANQVHDRNKPAPVPATAVEWSIHDDDAAVQRQAFRRRFDLAGGYNVGAAKNNFTLGVSVRQPLGRHLVLDAGIAMVSGSYGGYQRVQTIVPTPGQLPGISQTSDTVTENVATASSLIYLQASPSLSCRLYKGFSAGAGVDAQRLLSAENKADLRNSAGIQSPLPEWDFGLTGRMDLQVTKRLRTGVVYRESIGASFGGGQAKGRNYLLVQLGYSLF